jgi:hypothetical protein
MRVLMFKFVQPTASLFSFSAPIHLVKKLCYISRLLYKVESQMQAASANIC